MARILVIDDERDHREFLVAALRRNGHDTTSLSSGPLIIRDIREPNFGARYDLVITDILMPDTDGIEIILALRMAHPTCKIVAISGGGQYSLSDRLRIAEHLGADMTLAKPFGIAGLSDAVNRAMEMAQPPKIVGISDQVSGGSRLRRAALGQVA